MEAAAKRLSTYRVNESVKAGKVAKTLTLCDLRCRHITL